MTKGAAQEFTVVLSGITNLDDTIADALFEAGCDDATVTFQAGRCLVSFSREATSLIEAILSAISDIRKLGPAVNILRVDSSNLVSQSEIARRIGRSRQLVHQYISGERGPGAFPPPICDLSEGAPLWSWCEVAAWLHQHDMITESALQGANELAVINSVLELENHRRQDPKLTQEVVAAVSGK